MSFLKGLFQNKKPSPSIDAKGCVNAEKIIELINENASNFSLGIGMVIVIQLSWRVQIYFVNGIPICSWHFSNNQIEFGRLGSTMSKKSLSFELQKDSFARLKKDLKSNFKNHDFKITPLSKYEDEQWAMRISYGNVSQIETNSWTE